MCTYTCTCTIIYKYVFAHVHAHTRDYHTFPPSMHLVSITIVVNLYSHIILQKSPNVLDKGPERRERGRERGREGERERERERGERLKINKEQSAMYIRGRGGEGETRK